VVQGQGQGLLIGPRGQGLSLRTTTLAFIQSNLFKYDRKQYLPCLNSQNLVSSYSNCISAYRTQQEYQS